MYIIKILHFNKWEKQNYSSAKQIDYNRQIVNQIENDDKLMINTISKIRL